MLAESFGVIKPMNQYIWPWQLDLIVHVVLRAKKVKNMDVGQEISDLYKNLSDKIDNNYLPGLSRCGPM